MKKTMQRKLLEHLANVTEIDYVDLLKYFKEYHPATQTEDYLESVNDTLVNLRNSKYIRLKESKPIEEIGKIRNHNGIDVVLTLDLAIELWGDKLKGKITNEGRHYLADIIRNEKQDEINNSQKISNQLIALFTGILILLTAYPLIKDGCITKKESKRIEPQCQMTPPIKDSSLKNHTDSGISKFLQDSLTKGK